VIRRSSASRSSLRGNPAFVYLWLRNEKRSWCRCFFMMTSVALMNTAGMAGARFYAKT
jgi:hypothetical protein